MSEQAGRVDATWAVAMRRGPYALLALGSVLAVVSVDAFDRRDQLPIVGALVLAVFLLHLFCVDRRWSSGELNDAVGRTYIVLRWAIAFVLTWMNPFFAVFAVTGYFDSHLYVPPRWTSAVLVATAVTMAGSQSGGLPPQSAMQAVVFLALFVLNVGLSLLFGRIATHEAVVATERNTTIARLEEALAENATLQARLVEQAREAGVRDERERLALEIHDTIAQNLIGVITQLQAAADATTTATATTHREHAAELAREALGEARRAVQGLMPRRLDDADLGAALAAMVDDWSRSTGIASEVVVTGEPERLHRDVDSTVLRVAQESLANVGKHAAATRVGVTLSYMDDELTLDVRDDGVGFDLDAVEPAVDGTGANGGVGLHGMRQRAARLAGELVVESESGQGTAVSLRVPSVSRA